jgi:hypothetical protein
MTTHRDCGTAVGAIEAARWVRFKKRIVLGVRRLALGCILLVRKQWMARRARWIDGDGKRYERAERRYE